MSIVNWAIFMLFLQSVAKVLGTLNKITFYDEVF